VAGPASVGTLYLVATPIGNLGDITLRSIEVLKQVNAVAAEDTRRSRQLLSHLGISGKALHCVDAHASDRTLGRVVERLQGGQSFALLTDAGTPGVSDPGAALVQRCREAEIPVVALPGPSAVTTAVAASGLVEGAFLFLGFLPRKGEKRQRAVERLLGTREPVVLFEAPSRMQQTLDDLARLMPQRTLCVARELSKRFEQVQTRSVAQWAEAPQDWKGELTLVLGTTDATLEQALSPDELDRHILGALERGQSAKAITLELLPLSTCSRQQLYARVVELKNSNNISS
jgi:16S rRNA (cytidine1402-2'-O)-methyltransferase